jgi:hypothetical protein
MAGQIPGGRHRDLPVAALVQVGSAYIRMVQHCPAVRERINVVAMRQDLLYGNNQKLGVSSVWKTEVS